ncbi:helix-turn-helix domain-containing protein [Lactobacillus sp. 3B(2020)]|uniref:helix-turn-helix domain-containing protein n=1 Tax=Lactobacillus sp. 3B(2020) TaxID=2695882 RepID=UPI0021070AEF|nr:helix-turn-helix domain-containing protein [Lactobacillus sp. 3B(2020)]
MNFINKNISKQLTLEEVSQNIFLSPSYLSRIFKKNFNINFINYINTRKIALAQEKLALSTVPISKISKQVGFSQASYFTKIFKQKTDESPSDYRKLNHDIRKIYTISRDLSWLDNPDVFEISKEYFKEESIDFKWRNINGFSYIYSINGLEDTGEHGGWIYFVDCIQPLLPANKVFLSNKCVIQWIYTKHIR